MNGELGDPDLTLGPAQVEAVVNHLDVVPGPIGADHLSALLGAYVRRVPWESASRIARRSVSEDVPACARWPAAFWEGHLERGLGGTCFESNLAFGALLQSLGYSCQLTINDMDDLRGCHSALVVPVDGVRLLVDVGIPVYAPIPIDPSTPTTVRSAFHDYTLTPRDGLVYRLERDRHSKPYVYTFLDRPVSDPAYVERVVLDYRDEGGLFLDRVVICKVIDGVQHRFSSADSPPRIETFTEGGRVDIPLEDPAAGRLAEHFGMDEEVVARALGHLGEPG